MGNTDQTPTQRQTSALTLKTSFPKSLTVSEVLKSQSPVFQSLLKSGQGEGLAEFIIGTVENFVKINYPSSDERLCAKEFTRHILFNKPDWKQEDIICFLKYILDSQGDERFKVYGNTFLITPLKLFEYVSYYEEIKTTHREALVYEKKEPEEEVTEKPKPVEVRSIVDKILTRINAGKVLPVISIKEQLFDPIYNDLDFEVFKSTVSEMSVKDREKWYKEIFEFYTHNEVYTNRRNELLILLS